MKSMINKDEKRPKIRSKGKKIDRQIIRLINECVKEFG